MQVLFVVGPTASGKSKVALDICSQRANSVLIGCDSVTVYQGLTIGAAMPSLAERQLVRHELFDFVRPPQEMTAGDYHDLCLALLHQEVQRGTECAVITGGTGFYFQALELGLPSVPEIDPKIRAEILRQVETINGRQELYAELVARDPKATEKIHINDTYRLCRAMEVIRTTGGTFSQFQKKAEQKSFPFPLKKIGIDWSAEELRARIRLRTEKMLLADALLIETQALLQQGLGNWAPLKSVGYREAVDFLQGKITSKAELSEKINVSTWQLAKRQLTWFKRDKETIWLSGEQDLKRALALL